MENDLNNILTKLKDTHEEEILTQTRELYKRIENEQGEWYKKSAFTCPPACGECCRNFEPDLLECEALYMAAWLMENQKEIADKVSEGIFPFDGNKGCPFWDEKKEYHCTIYGGRSFICRLFGGCGSKGKRESLVFKPCKFYPTELLNAHKPPLAHTQYSENQVMEIFGTLPPLMTDIMESAVSLNPEIQSTQMLRKILPEIVRRLKWILSMTAERSQTAAD